MQKNLVASILLYLCPSQLSLNAVLLCFQICLSCCPHPSVSLSISTHCEQNASFWVPPTDQPWSHWWNFSSIFDSVDSKRIKTLIKPKLFCACCRCLGENRWTRSDQLPSNHWNHPTMPPHYGIWKWAFQDGTCHNQMQNLIILWGK